MKYNPWPYQAYTTDRIIEGTCGPLLDMGLGKTVSTLTALSELIRRGEVKKTLIIAPLRIADEVWSAEIEKWDHLRHLKLSKVLGAEKKRKQALLRQADIYIINRENVEWLVGFYTVNGFPFDCLVIDESSSFKNPSSRRFKALRKVAPLAKRRYILTGTPTPNGLLDLWSQVYILDQGQRLGPSFSGYRQTYFEPDKRNRQQTFSYKLKGSQFDDIIGKDLYEGEIHERIGDVCFSMKAKDYLNLPERLDIIRQIHFSEKAMTGYLKFERDQVLALPDESEITALNAAALTNKLLQYANGAVYDVDHKFHELHDEKLDSLEELVEVAEGRPMLIFYSFQHDLERIKHRLRKYNPVHLKSSEAIRDWNAGKISVLLAHPKSAGHGLNLQAGGDIVVWYSLPWSLEEYQQGNARLHRQGQPRPVTIYHLIATGTMDEDVMAALEGKTDSQEALMAAVKARIKNIETFDYLHRPMNRKLNNPNFQITELRLTNTVRYRWDDWKVTGLDLNKKLVQIERTQGVQVLEQIVLFSKLSPVPLWDGDNMLEPAILRSQGFENVDGWIFRKGNIQVKNCFPVKHYAEVQVPGAVKMVFFLHELENILIDYPCNTTNFPSGSNSATTAGLT